MKNNFQWLVLLFGCLSFARMSAQTMTFAHPGAANSKADLDFVKAKIAAGAEPWSSKFNEMKGLATAYTLNTSPQDGNENAQKADGRKAYANALAWYYTGNATYAQNAIAVLNVWGKTFKGYAQAGQSQLNAAWIGTLLAPAAEIMRGYSGWTAADIAVVQNMFKTKFNPVLNENPIWNNGNIDLTMADALLNIAVFCDDAAVFNAGVAKLNKRNPLYFYLTKEGTPSNVRDWYAPTKWIDGLTQETCRDNNHHAQFAMAAALQAAEVAWNQGVDVYGQNATRYIATMEVMANQILTGKMGTCSNDKTTANLFDTWEIGYNHFHNRKGINLPNTLQLLTTKVRVNGASDWNIFYETLTHNAGGTVIVNKAPTVSISAPLNNATFNAPATVAISANATDADGTISKVEFYNGATLLGTAVAAPYSYSWTAVAAGTYNITAKAYDNLNASAVSAATVITVKAVVGNQAPTVSISAPLNNATFNAPATVAISANATDADGTISKVEFYNGATLLGTAVAAPYSYSWNAVAAGTYNITAKSYDNLNASTVSAAVAITVKAVVGNQAPTVSISAPLNNATFNAPATVVISANATDADGTISKVEFYNGATLLGTAVAAPYSYSWTALAAGTYNITAKAYDNSNASTISAAVTITVSTVVSGNCATLKLTSTAWILRNNWSDQSNGSVLSNDVAGSLKVSHRAWGANYFWLISSTKYALTAGTKYTVSYDVMGSYTITSTELGITTTTPNGDPALAQASVVAPAGYALNTYSSKSLVITPTVSGSYYIALKINLNAQPPVVSTFNIKNLKYCPPTGAFKTDEQMASASSSIIASANSGLKVYPNPAQNQLILEFDGFSKYEMYNIQGALVLAGTISNKQQVDISSVDSGMYLVVVSNESGRALQRFVKE